MKNNNIALVVALVMLGSTLAFAAASEQGCSSSGNQAAGCGGNGGNGGQGGNGGVGNGGTGGAANANNSIENSNTATGVGVGVGTATSDAASTSGATATNGGNTIKTKVYSYGHSAPSAQAGSNAFSVGTFLGGIGVAETETYVKIQAEIEELNSMHDAKLLDDKEYKTKKLDTLKRLDKATRGRSRHLLNLFGIL